MLEVSVIRSRSRRLVILSVPLRRIARVLLCDELLRRIRERCDVVIVAPFAEENRFAEEFGGHGITLMNWQPPGQFRRPVGALLELSELLRTRGYWRRHRSRGLAYYARSSELELRQGGSERSMTPLRRAALILASMVGRSETAWHLVDALVKKFIFSFERLTALAGQYESVTLVQAASWGLQDRLLSSLAQRWRWRKVLVPYTTDQLFVNGYLLSKYDSVCVQGPVEERFAQHYHAIEQSRVMRLGSVWRRHIDAISAQAANDGTKGNDSAMRRILVAGLSSAYFPRASEERIVDCLLDAIGAGVLRRVKIIYRPVAEDEEARASVERRWNGVQDVELQWPQSACIGMAVAGDSRVDVELSEYVSQLRRADLVVTASCTSLSIDAAFCGVGSIAVFADDTGTLAQRGSALLFGPDGQLEAFPGQMIVHSLEELTSAVRMLLDDRVASARIAATLAAGWDFPGKHFSATLWRAIGEDNVADRAGEES